MLIVSDLFLLDVLNYLLFFELCDVLFVIYDVYDEYMLMFNFENIVVVLRY